MKEKVLRQIFLISLFVLFSLKISLAWNTPSQTSPANNSDIWNESEFVWTAVNNSLAYQFQIDTVSSFSSSILFDTTIIYIDPTGYSDAHLLMNQLYFGKEYFWRVRAYIVNDTSAWSSVWTVNTAGYIELVSPAEASQNYVSVNLDWNSIPGVNFYDFQLDTTTDFNSPVLQSGYNEYLSVLSGFADTEELLDNLRYGTTYYWRVRARNSIDSSQWVMRSFVTKENIIVDSPLGNTQTFTGVLLDWQAFDGAEYYDYRVDTSLSFSSPALIMGSDSFIANNSGNTDTEAFIDDLFFGTQYYWQVRSHNSVDTSAWSDGSFVTIDHAVLNAPAYNSLQECAVDIDWLASVGVDFYDYQVDISPAFNSPDLISGETVYINEQDNNDDTHMLIEPLKFSSVYYWRVRVRNAVDTTDWTNAWVFQTGDTIQLTAPFSSANVFTSLDLDWQDFDGVEYYKIELDTSANFNSNYYTTANVYSLSEKHFSNLYFGTNYYWHVQGINAVDTSEWSETRNFYTYDEVGLFTPVDGALNQDVTGVYLDWWYHEGVAEYQLEIDTSNMFNTTFLLQQSFNYISAVAGGPDTEFTTDTLESDKFYFWRVRAINEIDTSKWSEHWFSTGGSSLVLPATPVLFTPLQSQQDVELSPTLDWSDVATATEYFYEYSNNANFDNPVSGFTTLSEVPISGLDYETTYYWRVRCLDGNLFSEWTSPYHFTTTHEVLQIPVLISPPDSSSGNVVDNLLFDWQDVYHAQTYKIMYSSYDNFLFDVVTEIVSFSDLTVYGLSAETTYYWKVMAMNDTIEDSEWSDVWSFSTQEMLDIPVLVSPENNSSGNVFNDLTLTWQAVNFADGYEVEIAQDMNFTLGLVTEATTNTYFIFPLLEAETTYFWHVRATSNTISPSDWSTFWMFTTMEDTTNSISENVIEGISVFPNPASSVVSVSYPFANRSNILVKIYNSEGALVLQKNKLSSGTLTLNIEAIPAGLYFIKIETDNLSFFKKLIID